MITSHSSSIPSMNLYPSGGGVNLKYMFTLPLSAQVVKPRQTQAHPQVEASPNSLHAQKAIGTRIVWKYQICP